jgi:tryptophanase/pimeloyl-ACP methyl ester carboxylesterase
MTIYWCQPSDQEGDISEVLLMIAAPELPVKQVERDDLHSEETSIQAKNVAQSRCEMLESAGWNPLQLEHGNVEIDVLTDSWAERTDSWVAERMRTIEQRTSVQSATEIIELPWLPFSLTLATPSGRSAEAMLCRAWPGRRGAALHNGLFPTWNFNLSDQRFTPVAITQDEEHEVFQGNLPLSHLREALSERRDQVSFIVIELANNAGGGRPISLANLKRVHEVAAAEGVPLVLDASRIVENAVFITQEELGQRGRDPWMVVRDLLSLGEAAIFSLSKDFGVNFGGLVASRHPGLNQRLRQDAAQRGTDVSLSGRRLLQCVLSDGAMVLELVRQRMAAVRGLAERLSDNGFPVILPAGGHCVLVDVERMPAFAGFSNPVAACLAWIYQHTGIRGGPHLADKGAYPTLQRCIRLAVPIGMSVEVVDRIGASLVAMLETGEQPRDLSRVSAESLGPGRVRYRPDTRTRLPIAPKQEEWFEQQLRELGATLQSNSYAPANQNLEVVREFASGAVCRMVAVPEGEVEVLTVGAGATVLLMHPFNIGAGMFAPQMARLSHKFQVVVIHQPGVGRTKFAGKLSLESLVSMQSQVLSEMGLNGPIHVGGASVGAIFAEYFALRFPERILSLSLLGGSYRFSNRKGQIDKLEQVISEDFDMIRSGNGSNSIDKDRKRLTELLLRCESMDPHTGLRYLDLFSKEPDLSTRLAEIKVPTLVLQGRYDSVVGAKTGHFLHGVIPNARYVELPGSGHFVCFTDPEAVSRELEEFLQKSTAAVAANQAEIPAPWQIEPAREVGPPI